MTKINSRVKLGAPLPLFTEEQIKAERLFFESSGAFAYKNGGIITRAFFDAVAKTRDFANCVVDTRAHKLEPGQYPALPGYHHDEIAREDFKLKGKGRGLEGHHVLGMINGQICPTRFALGKCEMPKLVPGSSWNPVINQLVADGSLKLWEAPTNFLVWYHWQTFHEAQAAKTSGWRWFARVYFDTKTSPKNEIRSHYGVFIKTVVQS